MEGADMKIGQNGWKIALIVAGAVAGAIKKIIEHVQQR
jgi:hypothetical protein